MSKLLASWHKSISEIPKESWEILAKDESNPFYKWQWLEALETSGCIGNKQGWQPLHLVIWRHQFPIAIAPLYLKYHSFGEFIFDQAFVKLAEELGVNYYPKLIGMSPLSPIEGYQFLYKTGEDKEELTSIIIEKIDEFAINNNILSCNFLYVDKNWSRLDQIQGFTKWVNQKSLWFGQEMNSFDDYLRNFNSNQRRNIKRERKSIKDSGIEVSPINGSQVNQDIMQTMHDFYEQHCSKWGPWGSKYLSNSFFEKLASSEFKEQIVLFSAHRGNPQNPIAMSLCFKDKDMLWGRYWGSKEEIKSLHFEVCYYSPINWAIENGIKCFDPGAGGSHKLRRGFIAQENLSLLRWYDPRINNIIKHWLKEVNQMVLEEIESTNNDLPFLIKPH